jgi:alkaline phosphatase D
MNIIQLICLYASIIGSLFPAFSQILTGGPIVGAVTDGSAKIYLRADGQTSIKVKISLDPQFNVYDSVFAETDPLLQNAIHIPISGLQPDRKYFYRVYNAVSEELLADNYSFRTFPEKGSNANVRLIVGSCNYNNGPGGGQGNPNFKNDLMFSAMVDFDPHLFLHLGDWGYPPSFLGSNHLADPLLAARSFDVRYNDPNMREYILPNMAVDYIYDDDYNQNGTAGWTYPTIRTSTLPNGNTKYVLEDRLHPPGLRDSCITAYYKHFPAYPQTDTSGIHHKISIGNIDMFVVDTRSSKSPVHEGFVYNQLLNTYAWQPGPNRTTLGDTQRKWLLDGLKDSDADWKIIANSVVFNKTMGNLIGVVIAAQLFDRSLIEFATSIAYMWAGYPKDLNAVLNHIRDEKIENVLVFSGDTHSSMQDDGTNAGLPELSSSGLSADDEGYLNYTIDSIITQIGLQNQIKVKNNLWNGGGSGIDNANFSDTYATVEFFGKDSVEMCIIDEFQQVLGCMTIRNTNATVTGAQPQIFTPEHIFQMMYPNPAKNSILVSLKNTDTAILRILNMQGQEVLEPKRVYPNNYVYQFDISKLAAGMYLMLYETSGGISSRKFIKK